MLLHASCVALGGAGLLLLGPPGAGKSSLALRLMERGWALVADDQVAIAATPEGLSASAPPALAGFFEVRGLGLFQCLPFQTAVLAAVARLAPASAIPRLPEPMRWQALDRELPAFALDPEDVAAPEKAIWAMRAATGALQQGAGAFTP